MNSRNVIFTSTYGFNEYFCRCW